MDDSQPKPSKPPRETFTLKLRDAGEPEMPPPAIRLRRALKYLLRVCCLRCVSVSGDAGDCEAKDGAGLP